MKFFIRIIIFLAIAAITTYGYAWYDNKKSVDELIVKAGGNYKNTYIDLNGDSVINGIRVPLPGNSGAATIERVRTGTGNLLTNFKAGRAFSAEDPDALPDHFDLFFDIKGAKLPLSLIDMVPEPTSRSLSDELAFAGCGTKRKMTSDDYKDMGINEFVGDLKAKATLDKTQSLVSLDLLLNAEQLARFKANLTFANFNFNNPLGVALKRGSVELADSGSQQKFNAMCAKMLGLSSTQFTERHLGYIKNILYHESIFLSDDFYDQYTTYHSNPRTIKLSLSPDDPVGPMVLMGMKLRQVLRQLNAEVAINDRPINPLFGPRPDPSELPQLDVVTNETPRFKIVHGLKVQVTATSSIGRYQGYDAYFNYRGQKYKGLIKSVSGGNAYIRYEVNAGNHVEQPFRISEISKLRIRREYTPPKLP